MRRGFTGVKRTTKLVVYKKTVGTKGSPKTMMVADTKSNRNKYKGLIAKEITVCKQYEDGEFIRKWSE